MKAPDCFNTPFMLHLRRVCKSGGVSLAIALAYFAFCALNGEWHFVQVHAQHVAPRAVEFAPIPIMFILWVRAVEQKTPFQLRFSPIATGLCALALVLMNSNIDAAPLPRCTFLAAILSSLFVFVPFKQVIRQITQNKRLSVVALIGATSAVNYYWLMLTIWFAMCRWTTMGAYALLKLLDLNAVAVVHPITDTTIALISRYFQVWVNIGCNGLEGVFLFNFMLAATLLFDWKLLHKYSITLLFCTGVLYMFLMNVLRITVFFIIGYWAYKPGAWSFMHLLQGAPLALFHSYVGWVFYLFAFALFMGLLYSPPNVKKLKSLFRHK